MVSRAFLVSPAVLAAVFAVGCSLTSSVPDGRLIDPGFEGKGLAASPTEGWYSDDAKAGNLHVTSDPSSRSEGACSLRVEVIHPRDARDGQASVSQVVAVVPADGQRFELSLALRGTVATPVTLHICVWDGNVARQVAAKHVAVATGWTSTSLQFEVPCGYDRFGVFVYLPNAEGACVWLDDARFRALAG